VKLVNVQDAKANLSRLIEEAMAGEEIVIAKAGRPCVRLTSVVPDQTPRPLGGWGPVWIADDFDQPLDEIAQLFEGGGAGKLHDE
jgi:prevent-host-death family protein